MAQPSAPGGGSNFDNKPPPPYPGEPTLNYPNHEQVPVPIGWGSMPPPPPPYQHHEQGHQPYQYGATGQSTTVTIQPGTVYTTTSRQGAIPGPPGATTRVLVVGGNGCPNCRIGILTDTYDCCAIFLAIFFFPLGILCCLAMRRKQCTNCGASY